MGEVVIYMLEQRIELDFRFSKRGTVIHAYVDSL